MTTYARTDIASITVSAEGHGGCGRPHRRAEGERFLSVTCPQCEEFLRKDQMWAAELADVPPTYDEEKQRERVERDQARHQFALTESVAGLLAAIAGPRDLLAGVAPALAPAANACRKCSEPVPAQARFCGCCGAPALREITAGVA